MRLNELRYHPCYKYEPRIVSYDWVYDCLNQGELLIPEAARGHIINVPSLVDKNTF